MASCVSFLAYLSWKKGSQPVVILASVLVRAGLCGTVCLAAVLLAGTGCRTGGTAVPAPGPRDDLIGWYQLPNRHYRTREIVPGPGTLIPMFKHDGVYYSVCRGMEIPFTVCPNGLEWGLLPSSMKGTTIGLDAATQEPYIIIEDSNAQYEGGNSTSGERQFMFRIKRPAGLLEATAAAPKSLDDFIGCYQAVWLPGLRWTVRKEGAVWQVAVQVAKADGTWSEPQHEKVVVEPLSGRLGLAWGRGKETAQLVFNPGLSRFECRYMDGRLCLPLARVAPETPAETGLPSPRMIIGIPSWH